MKYQHDGLFIENKKKLYKTLYEEKGSVAVNVFYEQVNLNIYTHLKINIKQLAPWLSLSFVYLKISRG